MNAVPRYRVRANTHAVMLDGEVLVWDDVAVQLHRLNESASRIWTELSCWMSAPEVADALGETLATDPDRIRTDVNGCIEALAQAGLLECSEPGSG